MPIMEWTPALDVGVNEMNDEHKTILSLMNKLYDENEKGASKDQLKKTIQELGAFTMKHFADEEAYQASINYPDLTTHKALHANLLKKFGAFQEGFDKGPGKVAPEFFNFLKFWLSSHIQGIDKKYGDHAKTVKKAS